MKSLAEAMKPKFWQDSASVSENNIASASFDVAEEAGGSSPLSMSMKGAGGPVVEEKAGLTQRRLSKEEKRSIADAEDVMRVAALAAQAEETPRVADGSSENLGGVSERKTDEKGNEDDFDRPVKVDMQDTGNGGFNSNISSASSLLESYMTEEDYSRPLPPAPPSTPAAAKDAFTPLPYHYDVAGGELSYGDELRRDELKCTDQAPFDTNANTPPREDNTIPPPPFPLDEAEAETPLADTNARARLSKKYHAEAPAPDISGAATEPRRGGGAVANQADTQRPRLTTKSDFDKWDVGDRYQLKRMLGRGSYGEVAQAIDVSRQKTGKSSKEEAFPQHCSSAYVAVKKIAKAFDQEVDAIRIFREMHILRRLRGHSCVIQLVDVVQPRSSDLKHFNDLYLVFEYVDTDLYKLIMSPQYLTTEHIQTFLYQMLVGLKYIHSSSGKFDQLW